jgi:hypothetical protein
MSGGLEMRFHGFRVVFISIALIVLSKHASAEGRKCLIGAGIDNVFVSAQGGCEWDATEGFAMGIAAVAHNHLESHFRPSFGLDLTAAGTYDKRWTLGVAVGGGGHWVRPNVGGYYNASVFFTGTMATAPYVESYLLMYPRYLGQPNEDEIIIRQRLGLKVKMGRSHGEVIAGAQILSYLPNTAQTGGFALFQTTF